MQFSYSLWRDFLPEPGREEFHCHKKRGLSRVERIKQQDTIPQTIGKLAQKGIAYLYKHPEYLTSIGIQEIIDKVLNVQITHEEIYSKIKNILELYLKHPFLQDKKVIYLDSGQKMYDDIILTIEGIYLRVNYLFDCVIEEQSRIHIVDFKTGNTQDIRQAFLYILVGKEFYKDHKKEVVASFYNLERAESSEIYSLDLGEVNLLKRRILKISIAHKQELKDYNSNKKTFEELFPASPGRGCLNCSYQSSCEDSVKDV